MTNQSPKLILIPGLGTDERLFERQRPAFPDLWVPPWIVPRDDEGLAGYAARMAEIIIERGDSPDFPDTIRAPSQGDGRRGSEKMGLSPSISQTYRPIVLGGVSLGGMLAFEIARHVKPQAVVLIASCRTRQGIRGFFRAAGTSLAGRALWGI